MAREIEDDRQERMKQIASQIKSGKKASVIRKKRNKALIHLGLSVLEKAEKDGFEFSEIEPHIVVNEIENCRYFFAEKANEFTNKKGKKK